MDDIDLCPQVYPQLLAWPCCIARGFCVSEKSTYPLPPWQHHSNATEKRECVHWMGLYCVTAVNCSIFIETCGMRRPAETLLFCCFVVIISVGIVIQLCLFQALSCLILFIVSLKSWLARVTYQVSIFWILSHSILVWVCFYSLG